MPRRSEGSKRLGDSEPLAFFLGFLQSKDPLDSMRLEVLKAY